MRSDPPPPSAVELLGPPTERNALEAEFGTEFVEALVRDLERAIWPQATLYLNPGSPWSYAYAHPIVFGIASDLVSRILQSKYRSGLEKRD